MLRVSTKDNVKKTQPKKPPKHPILRPSKNNVLVLRKWI
jgi:hypothetical protein